MCIGEDILGSSTLDVLAELLCSVVFVEEIVGNLLQVCKMAVQKGASDGQKVAVSWVVHLNEAPGVLSGSDNSAADLNRLLRAYYGKRHQATQLGVLLDCVFVVLFNVVREVVDGDAVVLNVLHDELLGLCEFAWCEGVGLANDGDDVDARRKALHEFNIEFTEAALLSDVADDACID